MPRPPPRLAPPLIGAAALVALAVGAGFQMARDFAREKVSDQADARLAKAAADLRARWQSWGEDLGGRLTAVARSPTLKASASTGDPLTLAENLVEVLPQLDAPRVSWVDARGPGGAPRLAVVLDAAGPAPVAYLAPGRPRSAREDLLAFGGGAADPAPDAPPLPARLPAAGWQVRPLPPAWAGSGLGALARAAAAASREGPPPAASPSAPATGLSTVAVGAQGEGRFAGRCLPLRYGDRTYLGNLGAWVPLADLAALSEGLAPVRGGPPTAVETGPAGAGAPDAEAGVPIRTVAVPLVAGGPDSWVLTHPLDGAWTSLRVGDLKKPVFAAAVAILVAGLLLVPIGAYLWVTRPPPPRPTTTLSGGSEPSGSVGWGRSAVSQVLDGFPEDRYGKPTSLGAGGMGMVLKLYDREEDRPLAVKVMTGGDADPEVMADLRRRFLREARTMASFDHPGLPGVFAVAEEPAPHFSMEFIDGRSLQERFEAEGVADPETVCGWLIQAARALEHAHGLGVIHRDIKPDNLMLETDGRIRVIDFGIALADDTTRVTKAGYFVGTMAFIPPEQLGHKEVDVRADIYSLAATGYFLLSGTYPYTTPQLALGKGHEAAPLAAPVPAWLDGVLREALRLEAAGRPGSMRAFREALEAGGSGESEAAAGGDGRGA